MPIKNELKHLIATTVIISMILGGVAGAVAGTVTWTILSRSTSLLQPATTESTATPTAKVTAQAGLVSEVSEEKQTVKVVQGSLPAVVSVIATQELQNLPQSQFYNDFGQTPQNQDQSPTPQQPEKRQVSAGSGFIVDKSGLVITNKHVVSNTKADYSVVLSTGKTYPAEVIDRDSVQDLAILRIKPAGEEALDFPTIPLGNSESVQIGQTVIAIGNTLGEYQNTVTRGIVSGINRTN
ncbi:MAG: 2-alkenal reductase [Parcubacteria group bacterium GW2011_GWC2_44_22]|nr:MAG: 2-alkenal reductase [Parcubacteria group bacterium GW2011_GWC2_44_22]